MRQVGLARALSKLGYCSRSQAAELIRAGRVCLNGAVRSDPEASVHLGKDRISVDRRVIKAKEKIYLMMNKPRGLVTTASDEKGRETVYSILKKYTTESNDSLGEMSSWLAPVGRLDKASEGLLLVTNDSEWGARVAAPETHLGKTYHVQIAKVADEELLRSLTAGVKAEGKVDATTGGKTHAKTGDGEALRASHVRLLRSGQKNCWLEMVL